MSLGGSCYYKRIYYSQISLPVPSRQGNELIFSSYKGGDGFKLFGLERSNPYLVGCHFSSYSNDTFLYILADWFIHLVIALVHQFVNPHCLFHEMLYTSEIPLCFMQIDIHPEPGWVSEQKRDCQFSRPFFVCLWLACRIMGLGTRLY